MMKIRCGIFAGALLATLSLNSGGSTSKIQKTTELSRPEQLKQLQDKQILVSMWGWPVEEMAPAAVRFGYQVVNSPHGNDLEKIKHEVEVWGRNGLKMIARPAMPVNDPFDPNEVKKGCDQLNTLIEFYDAQPDVIAIVISWGLFGEGGFPWGYAFTDKAAQAFNDYMNTPGQPLPEPPLPGLPGERRWLKWLEFRTKTLAEFRQTFLVSAKQHTDKLVGTWSEVYPTEHYILNMGDAPGADFLFYDLSFGDVTCNQKIAFGESHGEMETFATFEAWKDHELPLMAKAAGEGVIPISFQFPMRCDNDVKNLAGKKQYCIDKIEEEYSLKIGADIRKLVDAMDARGRNPQVALVYQSFSAAALPGGGNGDFPGSIRVMPFYENCSTKQIEGLFHQMGVDYTVIPYEWLESGDLSNFKAVFIPDPLYINEKMRDNLRTARRIMYCGEYLLAHRDPNTQRGNYLEEKGFYAETQSHDVNIKYFKADASPLNVASHPWMDGISLPDETMYPADQMFAFESTPQKFKTLLQTQDYPIIFATPDGKTTYIANRLLNHAWHCDSDWLEKLAYQFLRNYLADAGVAIRVQTPPLVRVNTNRFFGSYGLTGNIAWNATASELTLKLTNGKTVTIPKFGWTVAPK
jgi:hypothetical protein